MDKLILIGIIIAMLMVVGFFSYQYGLTQNVGNETKFAVDNWCEDNNSMCINYCNSLCLFDNIKCANPDAFK